MRACVRVCGVREEEEQVKQQEEEEKKKLFCWCGEKRKVWTAVFGT